MLKSNVFLIDLPSNISISPVVTDLFPYRDTFEPAVLPSSVSVGTSHTSVLRAPSTGLEPPDEILNVLDDEFITSYFGGYRRFIVRWKDCPSTDDA